MRTKGFLSLGLMAFALLAHGACTPSDCIPEDQITDATPRSKWYCTTQVDYCGGPEYTQTFNDTFLAVDRCDASRQAKAEHFAPDIIGGNVALMIITCIPSPGSKTTMMGGTDDYNFATPYDSSCSAYINMGAGGGTGVGGSDVGTGTSGTTVGVGTGVGGGIAIRPPLGGAGGAGGAGGSQRSSSSRTTTWRSKAWKGSSMNTRNLTVENIVFNTTMDPQSLQVLANGQLFGAIMWHEGVPRVELYVDTLLNVRADVLALIAGKAQQELEKETRAHQRRVLLPGDKVPG
jgi:hypothetical protein